MVCISVTGFIVKIALQNDACLAFSFFISQMSHLATCRPTLVEQGAGVERESVQIIKKRKKIQKELILSPEEDSTSKINFEEPCKSFFFSLLVCLSNKLVLIINNK